MRIPKLLVFFGSLLSISLAATLPATKSLETRDTLDTDAYKVMYQIWKDATKETKTKAGVNYMFIGRWKADDPITQCVVGFSHVLLVVGQFKDYTRIKGHAHDHDFAGQTYEMVIDPEKDRGTGSLAHEGKEVRMACQTFEPNSRWSDSRKMWINKPANYDYVGETKNSETKLKKLANAYIATHPKYSLVSNNCYYFAKGLGEASLAGKEKDKIA